MDHKLRREQAKCVGIWGLATPSLPHNNIQVHNYLVVCFAVSLVREETIQGHNIKFKTIQNNVRVANKHHEDRKLLSPYAAQVDYISIVLIAVKNYEKQPSHRDMIYDENIHYMGCIPLPP